MNKNNFIRNTNFSSLAMLEFTLRIHTTSVLFIHPVKMETNNFK